MFLLALVRFLFMLKIQIFQNLNKWITATSYRSLAHDGNSDSKFISASTLDSMQVSESYIFQLKIIKWFLFSLISYYGKLWFATQG